MNNSNASTRNSNEVLSDDVQAFKAPLSSHLNSQVEALDYNVTSKLSAIRHRAVAEVQSGKVGWTGSQLWHRVAGGAVATALMVLLVNQITTDTSGPQAPQVVIAESQGASEINTTTHIIEDLQLLSATDDIDFYQSVEFLEWMELNSG